MLTGVFVKAINEFELISINAKDSIDSIAKLVTETKINKFELIAINAKDSIDSIAKLVTETKIDQSFTDSHIIIDDCLEPFRRHKNQQGGDILVFRKGMPCHSLNLQFDIEYLIFGTNLRKKNGYSVIHATQIKQMVFNHLHE